MIFSKELILRQLFERETSTYTYIIYDKNSLEAVIIDPVRETIERDCKLIDDLELKLRWSLETHLHADHITSASQLSDKYNCKIAISSFAEVSKEGVTLLQDRQIVEINPSFKIEVIATPGHTNCSISFLINDMLFSGDTLLIRGCGRTDFQQGSNEQLFESVRTKLFSLPDMTRVFPGHNYKGELSSSILEEKKYNPRLKEDNSFDQFCSIMNNLNLSHPKQIEIALPANKVCGAQL
ncbi:MBL fold metallo-hydrolase [Halobacteriovorax sp. HLS]|uniref:MBL fold metallo-hydrolase n=1 Tax=Halobacteriovorax sp. HLS TaxID=2234000 RepID=UPI001F4DEDB1|nr:MBL fold metallo-hydrolase [Halobacteriovorax sp. HLS]